MAFKTQLLTEDYFEAAFHLATEVFVAGSTLHRALKIELSEYRQYLHASFIEMALEGLSYVALDEQTGKAVGCLIASDFQHHLNPAVDLGSKFSPLTALTGELCRQYKEERSIQQGAVVLVDIGAVAPNASGRGVYQQMRLAAQANAKAKGFTHIVGELSSASTQHVILKTLGHKKLAEVIFSDFAFNGQRPFEGIKDPVSIILAEGEL